MSTPKKIDVARLILSLQDGAMTYFHLFDKVTRNDRFQIGNLLFNICMVVETQLADNEEAMSIMDSVEDALCHLDSCDPTAIPGDMDQQDYFKDVFDNIAVLKVVLDIEEDYDC